MNHSITTSLLVLAAALTCAAPVSGQTADAKQPAPKKQAPPPPLPGAGTGGNTIHATTSAVIGPNRNEGNTITISYGRPTAVHPRKGGEPRKIWGGLVPWGKADRMGADEATSLITQKAIDVGGATIPPGVYTLYIIPQENGVSKLAFSKSIGKWGVPVDESNDLVRADLKKEALSDNVDQLTIKIENTPRGSANGVIRIQWERTQFSLPFTVKS